MASQHWTAKLGAYVDGELSLEEERALREHLRECPACSADALDRMQMKRSVQAVGKRFKPDPAFRQRIEKTIATGGRAYARYWNWVPALTVAAVAVLALALWTNHFRDHMRERHLVSELVDQHVSTLASANPVDVASSDKHTVKPWFEGKLPFTFDLPELQGTPFTLVGGRTSYIEQSPAAELIFRLRQHQISVFIVQERPDRIDCAGTLADSGLSFHVRSWGRDGLCYFAVGDVPAEDLKQLAGLMKAPAS